MADPPLVLQISNEDRDYGEDNAFVRGFTELAREGVLRHVGVLPAAEPGRLAHLSSHLRPDLVLVHTPQPLPWTAHEVAPLLRNLGSPPLVVWEGDAWGGRGKPLRERNVAWMRSAEAVFSVAHGPQAELLRKASGRPVHYVPNTVPLAFAAPEAQPVRPEGVALLGARMTYCGIELIRDDRERTELVRRLAATVPGFSVYGKRWRGPYARGPVPYFEQQAAMRRALVTVGWNRYRGYPGFFSDRLPIAMASGRVHVSSRHPDLDWLPGPDDGLHLLDSPAEAADCVRALLTEDPRLLLDRAARMRRWVLDHLTETHALRHMLAPFLPAAPPAGPWTGFAAPRPLTGARAPEGPR
ncbi:glycosyltransferase family protein [Streptomyces sp. NBC_01304]|uniref:glycosyltransferase family protein n=1 Tax=Streptomyces sp. NBC_01304 TaxID=2903818 RepID=UPI002E114CE3|nr:hypothetical protein OG430_24035 [Streptomyces sp. NBC_01304]